MATLINNIRLRLGAIFTISIGIHLIREFAAPGILKATSTLKLNYISYAAILILSIIPNKSAWGTAIVFQIASLMNDILSLVLGCIVTIRCISSKQSGCIEFALQSILTLLLLLFVTLIDMYQLWNIYLCLRRKTFRSSAAQRVRILFSWMLPFGWMVNITLLSKSKMSIWATPHLVIDPIVIMLARSHESPFLCVLCGILLGSDLVHYMISSVSLVKSATFIQIILTMVSGVMLIVDIATTSNESQDKKKSTTSTSILPKTETPNKLVEAVPAIQPEIGIMRQRKSKKIQF